MKTLNLHRICTHTAAAFGLASIALGTTAALADQPMVPDAIKPAANERQAFVRHARGVQIYRCDMAEGKARWTFVAPEALMYENAASTTAIGTHGAGPFWQAPDGSRIVGKVKSRVDAAQASDIPWLLLTTTSQGTAGLMANVTSVQRVRTAGGVAPASGCAAAADAGKEARVPYVTDYVFFTTP
jgi:hypothetical protein